MMYPNRSLDSSNDAPGPQYAALETGARTDASDSENQEGTNPHYAMTTVRDETPMVTGNPIIDATTEKLTTILVG
jgi:hypothetical protein